MGGRRRFQQFDWSRNDRPNWLVRHGIGGRKLKFVELPPGSDLLGAFLEEALSIHREGWELTELTARFGWFIAHKRDNFGDTLMVSIDDRDPRPPPELSVGSLGMTKKTW